jgi:succinate dehydrogenase (ubiquinone) cytochrome b560 subunit
MSLVSKRPLSPDVLEVDGKSLHYAMPWGALSSIANRVTGTTLSVGFAAAGYVALTGDLPSALAALRADAPAAAFLARLVVALPLVYHYLGGVRHFVWDLHKIGNQADKTSLLEVPKVEQSSKLLFGASAVLGVLLAAAG